jgi:lipopolysaccharide transport system permease protein
VVVITPVQEPLWRYLNPAGIARDLWSNRHLTWQLAVRDVRTRFKGSRLGLVWSIINPLVLLAVYTFVFVFIFKQRWNQTVDPAKADFASKAEFALAIFSGLIVFNVFSESVNRATQVVIANVSYVKKVVFPVQVLPVSLVISSLFFALISTGILLVGVGVFLRTVSWTLFCFPLVLLPMILLSLGFGWFVASLGVYLRDVGQIVMLVFQILFFMTPICYRIEWLPKSLQPVMRLNPLATIVDFARRTLMWSQWPDWLWLGGVLLASLIVAQLGYAWFMKTKRGFADVV